MRQIDLRLHDLLGDGETPDMRGQTLGVLCTEISMDLWSASVAGGSKEQRCMQKPSSNGH